MRALVLQHVPFEDTGSIRNWFERRHSAVHYTRFFAGETLPAAPTEFDLIVAMGGPMSVNDEDAHGWLSSEKAFIRRAVTAGVPVLGVCLGAQLIASALGARVYRNALKEIGWFPIRALTVSSEAFAFPAEALAFHWHGETFDLPEGAVRLAESAGCVTQAFQLGRHVMGLQFHLEMTMSGVCLLAEHCFDELVPDRYVQDERTLLNADPCHYTRAHALMDSVLDYLASARPPTV